MKEKPGDLVQHLLSRAGESLEEAKILADSGHWNTCVSRLYYSCFYAASALLEKHGLSAAKHSGVRSLFNNHFARTETVSKEVSAIYNDLFDRRQESDYGPFFVFEETDVKPWFNDVDIFVNTIKKLVNQTTEKA
ncbi:MAG: HEPN domain-containing protein [Chitinivibrionales bacterium]|nr:HEPN domain-containing protein [Chitinivibrionales bacterium]